MTQLAKNAARIVGAKLATARKQAGLTQREVGERLGINNQVVSNIENGRYTGSDGILKRFADEVGLEVGEGG